MIENIIFSAYCVYIKYMIYVVDRDIYTRTERKALYKKLKKLYWTEYYKSLRRLERA